MSWTVKRERSDEQPRIGGDVDALLVDDAAVEREADVGLGLDARAGVELEVPHAQLEGSPGGQRTQQRLRERQVVAHARIDLVAELTAEIVEPVACVVAARVRGAEGGEGVLAVRGDGPGRR